MKTQNSGADDRDNVWRERIIRALADLRRDDSVNAGRMGHEEGCENPGPESAKF